MSTFLLNQPDDGRLSSLLKELLAKPELSEFDALVAFAVSSGVRQVQAELESLLKRGGAVRIVVGVSNKVTSVEGLTLLLGLVHKGANVFVFHNDDWGNPIFHPKLYLCKGKDAGVLIVGSNNMTGKGLAGNYEVSLVHELDLRNETDARLVDSSAKLMQSYCDVAGGFSHVLDAGFLRELEAAGYLGSEARGTNRPESSGEGESAEAKPPRKKLFASRAVPQPPVPKPAASRVAAGLAAVPIGGRGPVLWAKKLAKSDAQSQKGHPTGVVRLTQAKWEIDGKIINQITYFKRDLFGAFPWTTIKAHPLVDATEVQFDITILGSSIGVHTLKVSDKPSGEADQGNYTSSLHWGELADDIRKARLAGRTLRLYGPPEGSIEPFFLDIS